LWLRDIGYNENTGIEFIVAISRANCGGPLLAAGPETDTEREMDKNTERTGRRVASGMLDKMLRLLHA